MPQLGYLEVPRNLITQIQTCVNELGIYFKIKKGTKVNLVRNKIWDDEFDKKT